MRGWSRANFLFFFEKGLYKGRYGGLAKGQFIIFFEKGLYRADMKGRSRAEIKGWEGVMCRDGEELILSISL